jgi:hypothetical protein
MVGHKNQESRAFVVAMKTEPKRTSVIIHCSEAGVFMPHHVDLLTHYSFI